MNSTEGEGAVLEKQHLSRLEEMKGIKLIRRGESLQMEETLGETVKTGRSSQQNRRLLCIFLPQEGGKPGIQLECDQAKLKFWERLNWAQHAGLHVALTMGTLPHPYNHACSWEKLHANEVNGNQWQSHTRSQEAFRKGLCGRKGMQTPGKHLSYIEKGYTESTCLRELLRTV